MRTSRLLAILCATLTLALSGAARGAVPGGTFVTVITENPDTLNPYLHGLLASGSVYRYVFDSPFTVDWTGKWKPALAIAYTVSPDGKTWTLTLRPGVRWSDGQPFTSTDVKYTWQLATNKDVHITYATGFDKIASVDTPSATKVVYHLKEAYAPFKEQVMGAPVVPQHVLGPLSADQINRAPFNQKPVGTGPFTVTEFVTDDHVTLTANPSYWGPKPKLQRIVVRIVPDQNTQVNLMKAGDLSVLTGVPPARLEEMRRSPGVMIKRYLAPVYQLIQLDEYEFLKDVTVRQALDFGTPKPSIIKNVMKGQAEPAVSDMVPNGPWANASLVPRPYDLDRARAMLLKDGFAPGPGGVLAKGGRRLEIPLWTLSGRQTDAQMLEVIAQSWRALGVATDTHVASAAALFGQNGPQWNGRDAALLYSWGQGTFPENKINWHSFYIPKDANSPGENAERYSNPEMDRLLDEADRAVDDAKRRAIYAGIQELEHRDVPVIFVFWFVNNNAVAANVQGYDVSTFGETPPEGWSTR
ncbi:MAG TPA: peptide ABC transporter substrate-binding protein [bacterium]|nr:peptide ABC transporter substrate-binding protein [bacterium]